MLGAGIAAALSFGKALIERVWPDPAQALQAKQNLYQMAENGELNELAQQASTILAEERGESWIQRCWRPLTMLSFVAIIVNNYLLYPYLSLFWHAAPSLPIPPDMWSLLKIGLGGYVVGRSGEKMMKHWAGTQK